MRSRFTKVGFSGNALPSCVFPTALAYPSQVVSVCYDNNQKYTTRSCQGLEDLMYLVGESGFGRRDYIPTYPIEHGIIKDWNSMEHLYDYAVYQELRCCPEDHYFLITEPFNNTPVTI